MPHWLDTAMLRLTDSAFALLPAPMPDPQTLAAARIISHRGERDNRRVFENTYAAYDPLVDSGVWGLELDVRWSADREPMVFHDADLSRLFGERHRIADLRRDQIERDWPMIPPLDEFVARYGTHFHLMVELKAEPYPEPAAQSARLREILSATATPRGCHLISLQPALLDCLPDFDPAQTLGVARFNVDAISREAVTSGRAGIGTHYALLREPRRRRHASAGQQVGVGFPASARVMRRQLARGIQWIFTNRALRLQQALQQLRDRQPEPETR